MRRKNHASKSISSAARTSSDFEREERVQLSPFAVPPEGTAGRAHREPGHAFRSEIQRDRARIIHCSAFRRLDGKTQVFLNGTGDHYRTRLTHTIEVASISRTIARALRLNEDLANQEIRDGAQPLRLHLGDDRPLPRIAAPGIGCHKTARPGLKICLQDFEKTSFPFSTPAWILSPSPK